jgi:hypothetical protein
MQPRYGNHFQGEERIGSSPFYRGAKLSSGRNGSLRGSRLFLLSFERIETLTARSSAHRQYGEDSPGRRSKARRRRHKARGRGHPPHRRHARHASFPATTPPPRNELRSTDSFELRRQAPQSFAPPPRLTREEEQSQAEEA